MLESPAVDHVVQPVNEFVATKIQEASEEGRAKSLAAWTGGM